MHVKINMEGFKTREVSSRAYVKKQLMFSSVQSLSRVWLFATPWTATPKASLSITNTQSLLRLMSIKSVMPSNQLILCWPLLLPFNLSQHQGLFKWVSSLHQVAKVLEFQLQHQSFQEYSGLISFRMDWLDLFVVQGTLESSPTPQFKFFHTLLLVKVRCSVTN